MEALLSTFVMFFKIAGRLFYLLYTLLGNLFG